MKKIRIGGGAGYGGDRLEPALELMRRVDLDYIGFECLAERTIALAQREKVLNPSKGYNDLLEYRMHKVLPLAQARGIKVVSNMGAANPIGALDASLGIAHSLGLKGIRIAAVTGDDVLSWILKNPDCTQLENGKPIGELFDRIVSANAYLGSGPLVEALEGGADVILTGRVADPALFLAPLRFEFGWEPDDWEKMGKGTLIGHLLECAGQVCGGYYSGPLNESVSNLWDLGFPFAEVNEVGDGILSKAPGTGGIVNTATCTEQLLYEIHNPTSYLTPDCTADFSGVEFLPTGKDVVSFSGASGNAATETLKVSVGYQHGFLGEGQISYGGTGCLERARLAGEIVEQRIQNMGLNVQDFRLDIIGFNSLSPLKGSEKANPQEVRLRIAARLPNREEAKLLAGEVEALYTNGPAGGGGAVKRIEELVSVTSVLIPKSAVKTSVNYETV